MDSDGTNKKQQEAVNRCILNPNYRVLQAAKQLLAVVLAPEIVDGDNKKRLIKTAKRAIEAAQAELN